MNPTRTTSHSPYGSDLARTVVRAKVAALVALSSPAKKIPAPTAPTNRGPRRPRNLFEDQRKRAKEQTMRRGNPTARAMVLESKRAASWVPRYSLASWSNATVAITRMPRIRCRLGSAVWSTPSTGQLYAVRARTRHAGLPGQRRRGTPGSPAGWRAVHDADGGHHPFVLVLEDVAVEHESAELRRVEADHHEHARSRQQRVVVVQHVPVDRRGKPSIAEALRGGWPPARREIPVEDDELRLVDVEVVALVAVVDEQPIFPRPVGSGQVRIAVHLEGGIESGELRGICVLAGGRPPAWVLERDRTDRGGLTRRPFDAALREEIGHRYRSSGPVQHPEVLDVDPEQLASLLAEVPIVESDQADQVGIDPELGRARLVAAVVAGRRFRRRQRGGDPARGRWRGRFSLRGGRSGAWRLNRWSDRARTSRRRLEHDRGQIH